jgi:3-methyl-2-oxobutanoate hydroxymethyltransferase
MKEEGRKIVCLTAYDTPTARLVDEAGIDLILVGDSLGNNVLGYPNTLPVTMDDMVRHCQAVMRGVARALVVADLPFLSYQTSVEDAVRNAGRLIKEGGVHAVKLEGGTAMADTVRRLVQVGIPVMGHLGWTPQSLNLYGRAVVRGRRHDTAQVILDDARALQEAGAFAVVLEVIPERLANLITDTIQIPTIGIGAGPNCDGQILIVHDLLGLDPNASYRHAKRYADVGRIMRDAFATYADEVREGLFPTHEHSYAMDEEELEGLDQA